MGEQGLLADLVRALTVAVGALIDLELLEGQHHLRFQYGNALRPAAINILRDHILVLTGAFHCFRTDQI